MGLKDLFNKGLDLAHKGVNTVVGAAKEKKEAMDTYNLLITSSDHLKGMLPYEVKNQDPSLGREQRILELCLTMTVDKAKLINSLIPVEETIINVKACLEGKTQMNYLAAITNKGLWILDPKEYKFYEFGSIANFEIVNKSLMSQGVKFDNNAFLFEGSSDDIQKFADTIMNVEFRNTEITSATSYLCGITPRHQVTYMNYAGVTLGDEGQIVLHKDRMTSKKVNLQDIGYIQMLADNAVIMTRGKEIQAHVSSQVPCRKMTLKFILKNGETYEMEIMPPNLMGSLVKVEDSAFQRSFAFGRKVMDTVVPLIR